MVDAVLQKYGRIDILINNAGNTWGAPPRSIRWKRGTRSSTST
jgi:NAD(P)-dependent dehydrogenase (short-subunit alcohol dehydrogenase family)